MCVIYFFVFFFFSSRRRHTRSLCDWSSDVCSSDLVSALFFQYINWRDPRLIYWKNNAETTSFANAALYLKSPLIQLNEFLRKHHPKACSFLSFCAWSTSNRTGLE